MAVRTLQITLGAAATQVTVPSGYPILARHVIVQNNAAHTTRVGDSTVSASKGISLAASGAANSSVSLGPLENPIDLSTLYAFGTAADVLDIMYSD